MPEPKTYPVNPSSIPLFYPAVSKNYLLKSNDIRVADVWPFLSYTIKVAKHNKNPLKVEERNFLLKTCWSRLNISLIRHPGLLSSLSLCCITTLL